jgi:hypothetical protein
MLIVQLMFSFFSCVYSFDFFYVFTYQHLLLRQSFLERNPKLHVLETLLVSLGLDFCTDFLHDELEDESRVIRKQKIMNQTASLEYQKSNTSMKKISTCAWPKIWKGCWKRRSKNIKSFEKTKQFLIDLMKQDLRRQDLFIWKQPWSCQ